MKSIRIKVPATSANMGSGFDICGIALGLPFDVMSVSVSDEDALKSSGKYRVPEKLDENTCGPVIKKMREDFGIGHLSVSMDKGIRPSSGLGSSAASAAGVAYAANKLFGLGLTDEELVRYASLGEQIAAGAPHVDNVAPAILGGFTIAFSKNPLRIKKIRAPSRLEAIILAPKEGKTSTKAARSVLPDNVSRASSQHNLQCLSALICSMLDGDIEALTKAMDDRIAEPARAKAGILRHFEEIKGAGSGLGYGVAASGAGPAILILGDRSNKNKARLLSRIDNIFKEKHEIILSRISNDGIKVLG